MVMILSSSLLKARELFCGFFHTLSAHTIIQIGCLSQPKAANFALIHLPSQRPIAGVYNKLLYGPLHNYFRFATFVRTAPFSD